MVGFSDLSNELIFMIWDLADVEDVYNFSTVSKKVYLLVREALREHCRLTRRYSTITNLGAKPGRHGTVGQILKEIQINPRAALYPSLLEFEKKGGRSQERVPESDLELFKQTLRSAIEFYGQDYKDCWLNCISEGDEELLTALLVLILPNLREIHISFDAEFSFDIYRILRKKSSRSLNRLRTVSLKCTEPVPSFYSFDRVRDFAELPSVTSIHSHNVVTGPDDLLYAVGAEFEKINVVNLTFEGCCINPRSMSQFLSRTHNLEHFFYSPSEFAGNPHDFDPFYIRDALLANAQNTLKSLTILAGRQEMCFMGSLARFRCLESVQTNFRLLVGNPSYSLHTLYMTLPSSLVNITLHVDYSSDGAYCKEMIDEIADGLDHFVRLAKITIRGVADVRATELSHNSLISWLEGQSVGLSFKTE